MLIFLKDNVKNLYTYYEILSLKYFGEDFKAKYISRNVLCV